MRVVRPLLIAVEINWIDSSGALKTSTLRAWNPDSPAAPPELALPSTLNWRDQYVIAANTLSPLLDPIGERTVTFGGGYVISQRWQANAAVEYTLKNRVRYNNPELPFGPGAEEEQEVVAIHAMLSRRW